MNFGGRKIEASNAQSLDGFEKSRVETALSLSFDKLMKIAGTELLLHVHFKQHEAQGRRKKHTVHLKLVLPGKTFVSSQTGWSPVDVLQEALASIERQTIESVKRH